MVLHSVLYKYLYTIANKWEGAFNESKQVREIRFLCVNNMEFWQFDNANVTAHRILPPKKEICAQYTLEGNLTFELKHACEHGQK